MSKSSTPPTDETPDLTDPEVAELVEENRGLIERIADSDVALAERCQAVLDAVDGTEEVDNA